MEQEEHGELSMSTLAVRLIPRPHSANQQTMRQRIQAEETARVNEVQSLWHALSGQGDQSEARIRFWTENRLQKERAGATHEGQSRVLWGGRAGGAAGEREGYQYLVCHSC